MPWANLPKKTTNQSSLLSTRHFSSRGFAFLFFPSPALHWGWRRQGWELGGAWPPSGLHPLIPRSNLADAVIKIPAVLPEHFMPRSPEKSGRVLPLTETSSLWRNKILLWGSGAERVGGILSLVSALHYHLGVLLSLQKRLELRSVGHSRGRLSSSSLKPIQSEWQKQVAAIFKPVWGTPCDSTGNVRLKFQTKRGTGRHSQMIALCILERWQIPRIYIWKKMLPIYFVLIIGKYLEYW